MSHKVHPYGYRIGVIRDWKSRWFDIKSTYKDKLKSDILVYKFLKSRLRGMFVSNVEIERGVKVYRIIIETSRPGLIIGRSGEGMSKLRGDLLRYMVRNKLPITEDLKVDIKEVKNGEACAMIIAQTVAEGLEKRLQFRRVMKQALEKAYANKDVKGIKITLSGIMGGSNMARVETKKVGRISLQTLRADIDYALYEANLPLGKVGIKVWVYKGEIFNNSKKPFNQ